MSEATSPQARSNAAAQTIATASDRVRAFRQARRHTHLVRFLRLILPSVAMLAMVGYTAALLSVRVLQSKGVTTGPWQINPQNLTMETPKYDGFGKDGSRYSVRAKEAISDWKQTGPVRLNVIDGDLTQLTGVVTNLKATWGTYDQKKDILELYEKVDIDGSTGMKARLTRATVYTKESRVISDEPIYAETETGTIRAKSMTLNSKTRQATFKDAVHVKLKANQPPKPADGAQTATKPKAATPMPGLAANSGQPIEVRAEQLDVDDDAKTALFRKDVVAKQGDAILEAPELDILYEGKATIDGAPAPKGKKTEAKAGEGKDAGANAEGKDTKAAKAAEDATKLKEIKARGGVVMTNKEDRATAETLDYDAAAERAILKGNVVMTSTGERRVTGSVAELDQKADTALVTGDVVVTQGRNTMKGRRLFVERKTGQTRLESPAEDGRPAGRIATQFYQAEPKAGATKSPAKAAETATAGPFGAAFKSDPNAPIDIEADTLDVADQKKQALYKGNVFAKQGEFTVQTSEMTAFYTGQTGLMTDGSAKGVPKAEKGKSEPGQGTQLTRVEARQKAIVTGKDGQKAVGDWADFDVKSNTIVMGGKVVVSQGKNVINGDGARFIIDLTTGISRFEQVAVVTSEPGDAKQPMVIASPPATGPSAPGATETPKAECPPGAICKTTRMRAVLYPNDAKEAAKKKAADALEAAGEVVQKKTKPKKDSKTATGTSAWEATTNAPEKK